MDLTTTARVKDLLDISSATYDTVLGRLVSATSKRIENYLDRGLEVTSRTEEYPIMPRQDRLFLRSYPLASQGSVTSVKFAPDWDFSTGTTIESDAYHVDLENGVLHLSYYPLSQYRMMVNRAAPCSVQVVYSAGLAADTTALVSAYPDIALACEMQVITTWRRRDAPQGNLTRIGGNELHQEEALDLLPDVRSLLSPYVRRRFAANS